MPTMESKGVAYAPEMLLGLVVYGYASGVFSSRKLERATYESAPFIYIAGGKHPDHDTINTFRLRFLDELKELFVQVLLMAQAMDVLSLGNISLDGSKIHADASKSKAVSYERLLALEEQLRQEVDALFVLAQSADAVAEFDPQAEIERRQQHLAGLAKAKPVLELRAQVEYEQARVEYAAKVKQREEKAQRTGKKPRGRVPKPPTPGSGQEGAVQLHRPRVAHHEERQQRRLRTKLQRPGGGGPGELVDCGQHPLQPS